MVLWQQNFSILFWRCGFTFYNSVQEVLQNRRFFRLGVEIRLWSYHLCSRCERVILVLCNSISVDRSDMAASRFLSAAAACVVLSSFAAQSCKSYCCVCLVVSAWRLRMTLRQQIFVHFCRWWYSAGSVQLFCSRSCFHVYAACLLETCIDVLWLWGIKRGACSCSAHAHVGMSKRHDCSRNRIKTSPGFQVFSGERAAVLLTRMLACLSGMFAV